MSNNSARRTRLFRQVLLILMGIVILYLAAGFVGQARTSHQRRQELDRIGQQIQEVDDDIADLEQARVDVQSPEAAERWARENGMVKEGEVPAVVLAPSPGPSLEGGQEPGEGALPGSNREAWWELFFGNR